MMHRSFRLSLLIGFFLTGLTWVGHGQTGQVFQLKTLVFADSDAKVLLPVAPDEVRHVIVRDVDVLQAPDFASAMQPFIGRPIDLEMFKALMATVTQFAIKHDRIVNFPVPPNQDFSAGVFRVVVVTGRYNELEFKGNRWFSRELLQKKLGVKPGDIVSIARLDEAVNWANNNPFRRIQVALQQLELPGKTNMIVGVQEKLPLKLAASFDDTGNEIIGNNHYTALVQYGNLWGLDHEITYQFVTTDHSRSYRAHALDYRIPLPWRHYLQFNGSYSTIQAVIPGTNGEVVQHGKNVTANARYTVPLRGAPNPAEWFAAFDFKSSNNNAAYGGRAFQLPVTNIVQLQTGFSAVRRDPKGAWAFGATLNLSPGNKGQRNSDEAFGQARVHAKARYAYGTLALQRLQELGNGWQFFSRSVVQGSTDNLLGSEQLAIGGSTTVRGFDERILSGDEGFVFSNDLLLPAWKKPLPMFGKTRAPLETRFLAFYDVAHVLYKRHAAVQTSPTNRIGWDDDAFRPMAGAGVGIRMTLAPNFSLTFDYGWPITHLAPANHLLPAPGQHPRGHIKVGLAF